MLCSATTFRYATTTVITVSFLYVCYYVFFVEAAGSAAFSLTRPVSQFDAMRRQVTYESEKVLTVQLSHFVLVFFGLSSVGQALVTAILDTELIVAGSKVNEARYNLSICARMVEYGFSAPVMLVSIALLCQIRDLYTLVAMFLCLFGTNYLGLCAHNLLRYANDYATAWAAHAAAWVMCLGAYAPILVSFLTTILKTEFTLRPLVISIVLVEFVAFCSFGFVQVYDLSIDAPKESALKENSGSVAHLARMAFAYDCLSMVAKLFLGWAIMGPVFQGAWSEAPQ